MADVVPSHSMCLSGGDADAGTDNLHVNSTVFLGYLFLETQSTIITIQEVTDAV